MSPGAYLYVPLYTLERLEIDRDDLTFMLSDDSGCEHEFSSQNHVAMFGWTPEKNDVGKLDAKGLIVYLSGLEPLQIMDEIHLCIHSNDKWEMAWKGAYSLKVASRDFYCTKENIASKWECISCELCTNNEVDIQNLLTKYGAPDTSNNSLNHDAHTTQTP